MAAPAIDGTGATNTTNLGAAACVFPTTSPAPLGALVFICIAHRDVAVGTPTPSGGSGTTAWECPWGTISQGATFLTVWKAVVTSTAPTAPTISDSGDHQQHRCFYVTHANGTPEIHQYSVSRDATSDTSGNATSPTTLVDECRILFVGSSDTPDLTNTTEVSAIANATLSDEAAIWASLCNAVATGGGSCRVATSGTMPTAGAIGDFTYTKTTAGVKAHLVIAFSPPGVGSSSGTFNMSSFSSRGGPKPYGAFERYYVTRMHPDAVVVGGTTFNQGLDATVATAATVAKQVNATRAAAVATVGTMTRQTSKVLTDSIAAVGTMVKQVNKTATAGAVGTTATMQRQVNKILSATVGTTATQVALKVILKTMSATVGTTATMSRQVLKVLSATVAAVASMSRQTNKTLTDDVATVGTMRRTTNKTLAGAVATVATLNALKVILKAMSATVGTVATMSRVTSKTLTDSIQTAATMTRRANKSMTAGVVTSATMTKTVLKTMGASVATVGTMVRDFISGGAGIIVTRFFGPGTPNGGAGRGTPGGGTGTGNPGGGLGSSDPGSNEFDDPSPGGP